MNKRQGIIVALLAIGLIFVFHPKKQTEVTLTSRQRSFKQEEKGLKPADWFYYQRSFPNSIIPDGAYAKASRQAIQARLNQKASGNNKTATPGTGNAWQSVGPLNIGGRITDIESPSNDPQVVYFGAASGGIFKSTDGAINFEPIFDDQPHISIGDLAIDPNNSNIIYAGTGEPNGNGDAGAFPGDGIWKSTDAGQTWSQIGLPNSAHIGRIVIDPKNSDRIFVAATGSQYQPNSERGIYRSTDAGANWSRVLFLTDSTAGIDLAINPDNPDTLYAAMWERMRYPYTRNYGGLSSGLHRSTDGGNTWTRLNNGLPPAGPDNGRIGVSLCAGSPNVLYSVWTEDPVYNVFSEVYKSTDYGNTWSPTNTGSMGSAFSSFGWYFANIRVAPNNPNVCYVLGMDIWKTSDGGNNWNEISSFDMHVDQHALFIHPQNPNLLYAGCDGGFYTSTTAGSPFNQNYTLPINQFYHGEIDNSFPDHYYGGLQDNGTWRVTNGQANNYEFLFGGDGFYTVVDPVDNNYHYLEYQYGNIFYTDDGGFNYYQGNNGVDPSEPTNWNTPIVMDRSRPEVLYTGTNRVYKTNSHAVNWTPISPDLSNGPSPGFLVFGTVTSISPSEVDTNYVWAGLDDGNVWVTSNGGSSWNQVNAGLPTRYVTRLRADPTDPSTAYVTFSGYRYQDYAPHVFRTTNTGQTWIDISGNLPDGPVNDIIIDPLNTNRLFTATDFGVFFSDNLGQSWIPLGDSIPMVVVSDLILHVNARKLLAATYGRSLYTYDLSVLLGGEEDLSQNGNQFGGMELKAWPNPFSEEIHFQAGGAGKFSIWDINGKKVSDLEVSPSLPTTSKIWDGSDGKGQKVVPGVYFLKKEEGEKAETLKIIYLGGH